jgi:hypothetical protein
MVERCLETEGVRCELGRNTTLRDMRREQPELERYKNNKEMTPILLVLCILSNSQIWPKKNEDL